MKTWSVALKALMLMMLSINSFAEKLIAVTIDDLPFVGANSGERGLQRTAERFNRIVDYLVKNQVPATGFIICDTIGKGQMELLESFRQQGFGLGNHSCTHFSLSRVGAEKYIADVARADQKLASLMTTPKYYRYPYLDEGRGEARTQVYDYLASNQYVIAPVTMDSKDYEFNERLLRINWRNREARLDGIKRDYLNYIDRQISKAEKIHKDNYPEILLIHANLINSHALGDVIALFKKRGYRFITLDEAIALKKQLPQESTGQNQAAITTTFTTAPTQQNFNSDFIVK
jgi:peptidoglycan/xylan/chitin deacetylase (PgdA/CDA1 family)